MFRQKTFKLSFHKEQMLTNLLNKFKIWTLNLELFQDIYKILKYLQNYLIVMELLHLLVVLRM